MDCAQCSLFLEVTYYVLTNIEADMSDKYLRRGIFFANVVFRGAQVGNMEISGFKEDFQLVPKEDEKYYIERTLLLGKYWREPTVVPKFKDLPPLLETILYDEAKTRGLNVKRDELKLPLLVRDNELLSNVKQV